MRPFHVRSVPHRMGRFGSLPGLRRRRREAHRSAGSLAHHVRHHGAGRRIVLSPAVLPQHLHHAVLPLARHPLAAKTRQSHASTQVARVAGDFSLAGAAHRLDLAHRVRGAASGGAARMSSRRSPYRRLPGKRTDLFRRQTLWLGPDHLLRVNSTRFSEEYRRFYFRDIQAICLQKDPPRSWLNHGMISFAGALFVAGLFWSSHQVWGTLLVLALLIYFAILARRPQCAVWIQTAVGTDRLPSLRRIRPVRKAMAMINEKIYASQPAATPEALAAMLATPPPLPFGAEPAPRIPPPLPQSAPAASS